MFAGEVFSQGDDVKDKIYNYDQSAADDEDDKLRSVPELQHWQVCCINCLHDILKIFCAGYTVEREQERRGGGRFRK
jgi:hypothetical protein